MLARIFGVSVRRVYNFHEQGMPREEKGRYKLGDVVQWYASHLLARGGKDKSLDDQRKELLFEQTLKTRIENEISRQDLVPMAEVQTCFNTAQTMLASQLDSFARRMANELAGIHEADQIESRVFEECREVRRVYATTLAAVAQAMDDSGADTNAAPPKKRRRVGRSGKNTTTRKPRARKVAKQ